MGELLKASIGTSCSGEPRGVLLSPSTDCERVRLRTLLGISAPYCSAS